MSVPEASRPRVLVVDDEPLIARAMARLLAAQYEVDVSGSVDEALAHVRSGEAPAVILCDLTMPRRSGVELYEELQRERPDLAARVVFVTGGAYAPAARAFLERVRPPQLDKPFTSEQLLEAVACVLAASG